MARGNARLPVFENDTDRKCFLTLLETVADRFNFSFHAYCLMDNHYRLLVETPAPLSLTMKIVGLLLIRLPSILPFFLNSGFLRTYVLDRQCMQRVENEPGGQ